jgi:hypothetical protein
MKITSIDELLGYFRTQPQPHTPNRWSFEGCAADDDVYNPSNLFEYEGKTLIAARVEKRTSEVSQAVFFQRTSDHHFVRRPDLPPYPLQDPFFHKIYQWTVFGGTEVLFSPKLTWHTAIYYGKDLHHLDHKIIAPPGMKEVRLVELKDGRIGVFTRPQGLVGGRGTIGFLIVNHMHELTTERMVNATLLHMLTVDAWSGVNDASLREDGLINVLAHVAVFSSGDTRHYYPATFIFDPLTLQYKSLKIIAERSNFLPGPAKRPDLMDVIFSAGIYKEKSNFYLISGISDVEIQSIQIDNPYK